MEESAARVLELDDFVSSLFWSWQEAERIRGETHREMGHYDEAFADLTRAIELDPNYKPQGLTNYFDLKKSEG